MAVHHKVIQTGKIGFQIFFPHPIFSLIIQVFCLNADILKYVLFKKKCYEPIRVFEFYLKYEY